MDLETIENVLSSFSVCVVNFYTYILLTKHKGHAGRISARGLDSTKKTSGRYSPSTDPSKLG